MSEEPNRKLAAIVSVDVVGYSRLMGADEAGTLAAMRAHRKELWDPTIERFGGRVVGTAGDSLLVEFASAVAAVESAIAVQRGMAERNAGLPDDRRMLLRIGINIGEVIVADGDIFGDGVNLAARLQGIAEPGGLALSGNVHEQVDGRLDGAFTDDGLHEVKNIARPVPVWRWSLAAGEAPSDVAPVDTAAAAGKATERPLALPDKPSIAVLPFDNMSGDPEQDFFADGMTEDLITDLSKISGLFVVARNSSFAFKGQAIEIRDVARRLGVRHVVEGSVRKAGTRVRINVQLIDAVSGGHLWAERYDGTVDNVFELQDEVGAKVVSALAVRLSGDESERLQQVHTRNLEAYELFVRAKATPYPPIPERIEAARGMFERVIELDPGYAGGYAGLSWMLGFRAVWGHFDVGDIAAEAAKLARKAIEIDETFGWSHTALGLAMLLQGRHEDAIAAAREAIRRQPSDADAHAYLGLFLAFAGQPESGTESIEQAIRLNPQFVNSPYMNLLGLARLLAADYEGTVRAYEENLANGGPLGPPAMSWAAGVYEALGRTQEARDLVARLADRFPGFRLRNWNFLQLPRSPADRERFHDLLRAAGVPE
jgi:adenylate cyclase